MEVQTCPKPTPIANFAQPQTTAEVVAAKFVIYQRNLYSELHPWLLAEMHALGAIVLINCVENMNKGKSFEHFTEIRKLFPHYLYYAKTGTDSYILYLLLALAWAASEKITSRTPLMLL